MDQTAATTAPHDAPLAQEIAASLARFVRDVAGDSVNVSFANGIATVTGTAPSETHARAILDLVRWHDGVEGVESNIHHGDGAVRETA
jgi:hypothetical protein